MNKIVFNKGTKFLSTFFLGVRWEIVWSHELQIASRTGWNLPFSTFLASNWMLVYSKYIDLSFLIRWCEGKRQTWKSMGVQADCHLQLVRTGLNITNKISTQEPFSIFGFCQPRETICKSSPWISRFVFFSLCLLLCKVSWACL